LSLTLLQLSRNRANPRTILFGPSTTYALVFFFFLSFPFFYLSSSDFVRFPFCPPFWRGSSSSSSFPAWRSKSVRNHHFLVDLVPLQPWDAYGLPFPPFKVMTFSLFSFFFPRFPWLSHLSDDVFFSRHGSGAPPVSITS